MKRFLFTLLISLLTLAGCSNPDNEPPAQITITIAPGLISLTGDAQVSTAEGGFTVECQKQSGNPDFTTAWRLTSNQSWLKLSLDPGGSDAVTMLESSASRTIYLVVEENTDTGSRTAEITLNNETPAAVTVTQAGFIPGTITVTPASLPLLNGEAHVPVFQNLTVTALRYNGTPDPLAAWSLSSNQTWLKLSLNSDGSDAISVLSGTGTKNVYLTIEENLSGVQRTAEIRLNDGSTPVLTITQDIKVITPPLPEPDPNALNGITGAGELPSASASYLGAFWRAGQIGERVICTNVGGNAGAWSAEVAWYGAGWDLIGGDGVVLAVGDSEDPNIRHATNAPADAENYTIGGTLAKVSGTADANGYIVFRAGLTKAFRAYDAESAPARYAVVLLTYADGAKKQKIFLRQGEGADYVMRPGDKDGNGSNVGDTDDRSFARKFLPYNLTASDAQWAAKPGGTTVADYPQLDVNGGTLVQYPSQGGGIFQGQGRTATLQRRVFSHTVAAVPTDLGTYTGGPEFWSPSTDETCPVGYRRARDGGSLTVHNTTTPLPIKGSEMRQSLWLNPIADAGTNAYNLDNSEWGYYADGFFDRRQITNGFGASAGANGAVSASTKDAAYLGRLFYNPITNAAIFLPATGYRTTGNFQYAGDRAYYWMESTFTATNMACIYISNTRASPYSQNRTYGWSIRCIKE